MRRSVALLLLPLLAAPLSAQFEGTITMKMNTDNKASGDMTMTIAMKGDMQATTMMLALKPGQPPMEMRSIMDGKAHTMTSLVPMMAGMDQMPGMAGAKGIKYVTDLSKMQNGGSSASNAKFDIHKLGTSEKIAGYDCDDYEAVSNGKPMRMCLAQSLGGFTYPMSGGMGRGGSTPPGWAAALGKGGGFPLKVWTTDGKVAMEVTAISKGSVPNSTFEIPDGYMDMGAMMGRGRGN